LARSSWTENPYKSLREDPDHGSALRVSGSEAGAEGGADQRPRLGGGYVEAEALLRLMRRLESAGLPTRFPHPAGLALGEYVIK
jgi:hypothetical protein